MNLRSVRPRAFDAAMAAALSALERGDPRAAFASLERAHVLGQPAFAGS
jgi:hypothetical protein